MLQQESSMNNHLTIDYYFTIFVLSYTLIRSSNNSVNK